MKLFFWISILLLLLTIGAYVVLSHILPYAIVKPYRMDISKHIEDFRGRTHPNDFNLNFEEYTITVTEDIQLHSYYIKSNQDSAKTTIIFLHGVGGVKEGFLGFSKLLAEQGYNSFLYDARAHGQSSGEFCTYGFKEKADVVAVINYLEEQYGQQTFAIWGNSLGGAVALQALAIEPRLQFGLIESTFADLRIIVNDYQKRISGLGWVTLSNSMLDKAGRLADFDPDQVKPGIISKQIQQPVLLIHGDADPNIKVDYGRQIYEQLASPEKELLIVHGGTHYDLYATGGMDYEQTVLQFLEKHSVLKPF